MLRVVVLQVSALLGGSDRSLLDLLKEAHGRRFQASVILPNEGPLCAHLTRLGVRWVAVEQPRALLRQSRSFRLASLPHLAALPFVTGPYLWRLASAIHGLRPDVVYTNGIKAHVLSWLLRPVLRSGVVWHYRDYWNSSLIGRMADGAPDTVIANSQATAQNLMRVMKRPEKVVAVHNPVDSRQFSPHGARAYLGAAGGDGPRVGLVAALTRWKGHRLFLRAAKKITVEFPSARFFLIGGAIYDTLRDRGYQAELRQFVEESGLARHVTFAGFQESMAPWYRGMDVVVNASIRPEPFGRTLLEAMSCGRAVVGPDAGGVPEFLRHRRNGLLYEMGSADALAGAVRALLLRPGLRRRLGAAGREGAVHRFTLSRHAGAVSEVLHDAARTRGLIPRPSVKNSPHLVSDSPHRQMVPSRIP